MVVLVSGNGRAAYLGRGAVFRQHDERVLNVGGGGGGLLERRGGVVAHDEADDQCRRGQRAEAPLPNAEDR